MEQSSEAGQGRARARLPIGIFLISAVVALAAVSGLIYLLYQETRGPGEILRDFARHVDDGDCPGSYELLDETVRSQIDESAWCEALPTVDEQIDADFDVEQAVLQGDESEVQVTGVATEVWRLRRFGERSWRVLGPEEGFVLSGEG